MNIGHPAFLLIALFLSSTPLLAGESPAAYCSIICPSDSSDDDYPICDTPAAFPLPPFGCSGFFLTYEQGVANFGPFDFFGDPAPVGAVGAAANATSYNSQDGYLYAVRGPDEHILRLHDDGTVDDLGGVGLPNNIVVGGFDESETNSDGELS